MKTTSEIKPEILAPAGTKESCFAAIAAGADAIYCGLKNFSARIGAKNFSMEELYELTELAHSNNVKVYVTLNSLVKPCEIERAACLVDELNRVVNPDGLIIQDLGFISIARQVKFNGEIHLSTLSNVTFQDGLKFASETGVHRVVLPRELNIDEIKLIAENCSENIGLELFIHGALCYGISGRCYWSSFLGGKSGLRGRCVQPCRRIYEQKSNKKKFFCCQDLSMDVLIKIIKTIPQIKTLKIEGRKKGPHYVYYTVKGYRMLVDHGDDPKIKKTALLYLEQALGRNGTHYNTLPQRPQLPVNTKIETASGRFVGNIKGESQKQYIVPRENLLIGDLLRIGYEDEAGHTISKITKSVPKKGKFYLKIPREIGIRTGTPVFLIDRREKELQELIQNYQKNLDKFKITEKYKSNININLLQKNRQGYHRKAVINITVLRNLGEIQNPRTSGLWISSDTAKKISRSVADKIWFWLPPVIWPENEKTFKTIIEHILGKGGKNFMLNMPCQISFFKTLNKKYNNKLNLWAGPFCNLTNGLAINVLKESGFHGVIVSPELNGKNFKKIIEQSPLPLGALISGNWPLLISRTKAEDIKTDIVFTSPKGEQGWIKKHGYDFYIYPNWKIDISSKIKELEESGYTMFVTLKERVLKTIKLKDRPGLWNWNLILK